MTETELEHRLVGLKRSARLLQGLETKLKNDILETIASKLLKHASEILAANRDDLARLDEARPAAFRDRLALNGKRLEAMANSMRAVAALPDPVHEIVETKTLANDLRVRRIRAPLGAILMIFESRPNVITEVFSLAFKAGNAVALRGGSESRQTANAIYALIDKALSDKLPFDDGKVNPISPFVGIEDYDRLLVGRLLARADIFDICIPRGGDELIARVTKESQMPVIKNDRGLCHLYIHEEADLAMAVKIAINSKVQRPGVCNAIETILIDRAVAEDALGALAPELAKHGVQVFACEDSLRLLRQRAKTDGIESTWMANVAPATDKNFRTEYLDLKINLKLVEGFELALYHIEKFGSSHSECIVTANERVARRFQNEVDSACVYWNASTRFTDGFELGLGGEIGISTQKLHVRGPVGLRELTSPRWVIDGVGQIRN